MIRSCGEEYVHMSFLGFLKQIHFSVPTISEKLARTILDDINADDLRRIPGWQQRWKLITIQLGGNDICRYIYVDDIFLGWWYTWRYYMAGICRFPFPRHTSLLFAICVSSLITATPVAPTLYTIFLCVLFCHLRLLSLLSTATPVAPWSATALSQLARWPGGISMEDHHIILSSIITNI